MFYFSICRNAKKYILLIFIYILRYPKLIKIEEKHLVVWPCKFYFNLKTFNMYFDNLLHVIFIFLHIYSSI